MLVLSLVGALAAAICFGLASVMQAVGLRRMSAGGGPNVALLLRALRSWAFVVGTLVDLLGFGFELLALRKLPLFLVQAAVAASLAVTAIAASVVMRERLGRGEWLAVVSVCLGLAALGVSAGPEGAHAVPRGFFLALGGCLVGLGLLGAAASRLPVRLRTVTMGACAGLCFGVLALAARTLPELSPARLLREPATYLVAASGLVAFLLWTSALSSGSVTTATAGMVVGETLLPALAGVLVLGDGARPGFVPVALAGFVLAVGGALALARFGEVGTPVAEPV